MRKNVGSFRATVWDPRLIIAQIISVQGFFYASLFLILFFLTAVTGEVNSLNQIYDYGEANLKSRHGVIVFLAFLLNAPMGSVILWYVVKRTKQCLDFAVTTHVLHLIGCWIFSGMLTSSVTWWLLQIVCVAIMSICGEFLCMRTELAAIPVNSTPVADL